jgi:ribonuclease I
MENNDEVDLQNEYKGILNQDKKKRIIIYGIIASIILILLIIIIKLLIGKKEIDMVKEFDYYLFAFQCPLNFCYTLKDNKNITKCINKTKNVEKGKLTIHGLWPSILNKEVIDIAHISCNKGKTIPITINNKSDIYDKINKYWPSGNKENNLFWTHEYNKHGYCYNARKKISTQDYEAYFKEVIRVFEEKKLYDLITDLYGVKSSYELNVTELQAKIKNKINGTIYISCVMINNTQYINEFQVAFNLSYAYIENKNIIPFGRNKCNESVNAFLKYNEDIII